MIHRMMRMYSCNKLGRLLPFLGDCKSVADVGSGTSYLASLLADEGFDVTALDVVDVSKSGVVPVLFDGTHIPYPDQHFDASILVFVLHHATDQLALLKEVFRVTGKRVVILEDTPGNRLELLLNSVFDKLRNGLHGIASPLFFKDAEYWELQLESLGGRIVQRQKIRQVNGFWTFHYTLFVIDKMPT